MTTIKPGIYRHYKGNLYHYKGNLYHYKGNLYHYKGNLYEVIGTAQHSETEEKMVVYRALYGDFGLWVRPAGMFAETITDNGQELSRFTCVKSF